ncbi:ABC transporter permease [Enterococcus camelliae]|uniref:ABC transporter permease n=1 Tax=Enterococcus camelliae TaxID=453959 RepID=A0ABW5TKU7_9ENTE
MNKQFVRSAWRDIRQTPARFLSLVSIIFLGVAFFVGIKATAPDMKQSADAYFREMKLADITMTSMQGFSQAQINDVTNFSRVKHVAAQTVADVTFTTNGEVVRLSNFDEQAKVNQVTLIKGRFPKTDTEIVLDQSVKNEKKLAIGDQVTFHDNHQLQRSTYTIVGFIQSPVYLDETNRGASFVGNGSVAHYGMVATSNFVNRRPTTLAIQLENSITNAATYSSLYKKEVNQAKQELHAFLVNRASFANEMGDLNTLQFFTRQDVPGYSEYKQNANRIDSLATVFPTIFFLIACLISLTSVRRMVDEKRMEVGLFFALGYRPVEIIGKFLLYVGSACLIGVLSGLAVGFTLFPKIIIEAYSQVYSIRGYQLMWPINLIVLATLFAIVCTIGVAIVVLMLEVKRKPAELMRPKAPRAGQRILLEQIRPFWRRVNFHYKVMFRNLFRYKGRMWLTIIGIASCTAMILTGFGLKDSIGDIVPLQFQKIWNYQAVVTLGQEDSALFDTFAKEKGVAQLVPVDANERTVTRPGYQNQKVVVTIPKNRKQLNKVQLLQATTSNQTYTLPDEGAFVSEKLATLYHLKRGDVLSVQLIDGQYTKVRIAQIVKNYVGHALFLSSSYYQKLTGNQPIYRTGLVTFNKDFDGAAIKKLTNQWQKQQQVVNIRLMSQSKKDLAKSLGVLTLVVWILIIAAGMLAFIVLYSLNSMNVSERIRELSTMKVLGFFHHEVTLYVFRENILLALIGIGFGLFGGTFLHRFVIQTVEMDTTLFVKQMHWQSYFYAGGITFLFTLIVGGVMHLQLKKIDMLDALKANE